MRNPLYRKNGKRNFVVGGFMALAMAIGGTAACGSSHHTASVACADTAESAFTLTPAKPPKPPKPAAKAPAKKDTSDKQSSTNGGSSGTSGNKNKDTNKGTGKNNDSDTSSNNGGSSGSNGSNNGGTSNNSGTGTSTGTSTNTGSSVSTFDKNAKTGLKGTVTMPKSIPAPPKGTTRVTIPGESAYTPPSNKVQQPKTDIQAAQASVQNRRFLMSSGSHYRSPVTKHVYYYHPRSYYTGSVYQDLYNPYDGRNYRSSGYGTLYGQWSPFWGLMWATYLVGSC